MLSRKYRRTLLIAISLTLLFSSTASSGKPQDRNKSAAELFPINEFLRMLGARPAPSRFIYSKPRIALTKEALQALPDNFSWLEKGIMTSIKFQGTCGSCWAFAAVGVMEALIKRSDGVEVDLSEQQLVNCVPETYGCDGGFGWYAHVYMVNSGIVRESVYPYQDRDWPCDLTAPSEFYLTKAWLYMKDGSETKLERRQKIKHIIKTYGPVDTVLQVYEDFYRNYTSGVYMYDGISAPLFFHGGVIAGWVDDSTIPTGGYWIVKNDWGPAWGENGYFRIAYDSEFFDIIEFDIRYSLYNGIGNDPPYFEGLENEYDGREGIELVISNYAKDPDGTAIIYSAENMPTGMSINAATGIISWTPSYIQAGSHTFTISITDGTYSFHRLVTLNIKNIKKIKR